MDRHDGFTTRRGLTFVAVVGFHAVLVLIMLFARNNQLPVLPNIRLPLTLLALPQRRRDVSVTISPSSIQSIDQRLPAFRVDPTVKTPELEVVPVPGLQTLDLEAESQAAIQQQNADSEADTKRRTLAGPPRSQRDSMITPAPSQNHKAGDSERTDDGQLLTWINNSCYLITNYIGITGIPTTMKVCKRSSADNTHMFKDMRKRLDKRDEGPAP